MRQPVCRFGGPGTPAAVLFAILTIGTPAHPAGPGDPVIKDAIHVSKDLPDLPHVEPVVAIDQLNPANIVVSSIVIRDPFSEKWNESWTIHVIVSSDSGRTWDRRLLPGLDTLTFSGDPWLSWPRGGDLFLSCLVSRPESTSAEIWLYHSRDGGYTWSEPIVPITGSGSYDHPVLDVMMDGRKTSVNLFATGGRFGAISHLEADEDFDFSESVFSPDSLNNNLGSGVVCTDGTAVYTYYSMSQPMPTKLWAVRGKTLEQGIISDVHVPIGFPMMAIHRPSDRIHAVWIRSEQQPDIEVAFSDDQGRSWSSPVVVQSDSNRTVRARPYIAANNHGTVCVTWADGRNHESGGCWDVFAAISNDGGTTFSPEMRLSPLTTCPNTAGNGGAGMRWRWGGDYSGVASDSSGVFSIVWSDTRTGLYQIWLSTFSGE